MLNHKCVQQTNLKYEINLRFVHCIVERTQLRLRKNKVPTQNTHHGQGLLSIQQSSDIIHHLTDIKVGDFAGPPGTNSLSTIYQHHGYNRNVPFRLHTLVVII